MKVCGMTPNQAIKLFGTVTEMAKKLKVSRQVIYNWRRDGKMPDQWQALAKVIIAKRHAR